MINPTVLYKEIPNKQKIHTEEEVNESCRSMQFLAVLKLTNSSEELISLLQLKARGRPISLSSLDFEFVV